MSAATPSFRAFLSYSHVDKAAATRLHRKLENYRLPGHLRQAGSGGRIGTIFRDSEDLPAATDLSASVRQALAASQALIVLCSPDAKASRWVAREIALFRELHPGRPILAALLRGEPDEAFPTPLHDSGEPLAADLRKDGDGYRLGFLKVVAGVVGVPLDALVQRDSQRQVRRVMAVTGLATTIALVMAVMTVIALQARSEAQTLRQNSDAFIDELLTDGRDDLVAVGRLDILDKFNARALRFYTKQGDPASLPADSLENWASILHAMGEDETKKVGGNLDKAREIFGAAHSATRELHAREPGNADRIFAHAQSQYWVGYVAELKEDYAAAHGHYSQYRDLARALAAAEPSSLRSLMELGHGELNMGIMSFQRGDMGAAGAEMDRAIGWFAKAHSQAPQDRNTGDALANAHAWRFDVFFQRGDFARALDERLKSVAIIRRTLAAHPDDREVRFSLLIAERAVAMTRCELGDGARALVELRALSERLDALVGEDRNNREWSAFAEKVRGSVVHVGEKGNCNGDIE
jgi:tetratricopeptide (TPR) repeat protein